MNCWKGEKELWGGEEGEARAGGGRKVRSSAWEWEEGSKRARMRSDFHEPFELGGRRSLRRPPVEVDRSHCIRLGQANPGSREVWRRRRRVEEGHIHTLRALVELPLDSTGWNDRTLTDPYSPAG